MAWTPETRVVFHQGLDRRSPAREWLAGLERTDPYAHDKCTTALETLQAFGHQLRRPASAYLRDGIHELRVRAGHVNYRLLYFFHGRWTAVIVHGLTKEDVVPDADIQRALRRKLEFESSPTAHTSKD